MGYITLGTGHHHSQHHPLNFRSLQGLENGKQKAQLSPTNSNSDHSSTTTSNKKCMNCNGGTSSPSTASTTSTGKVSHDMSHIYVPNFWVDLSFNSRVILNFFLFWNCKLQNSQKYLALKNTRDCSQFFIQKWSVSKQENVEDYPWVKTQVNLALEHINVTMTTLHTTWPELSKVAKYFFAFFSFIQIFLRHSILVKWNWTLYISTYCKRF